MELIKFLIRLSIILAIPLLVAYTTFGFMKSHLFDPMEPDNTKAILVDIPADASSKRIGEVLTSHKVVKAPWVIQVLSTIRSKGSQVTSGEYQLSKSMKPSEVLDTLMAGKVFKREIKLEPGSTVKEIAQGLQNAGIIEQDPFIEACHDKDLLVRAGINANSFEGYLFPATYHFGRGMTPARIIWRMLEEGENHWTSEYTKRAEELQLSRHEILTMASLILAETESPMEMATIAGVFHNRLVNLMKLQSRPAVLYGLGRASNEDLSEMELRDPENLYNTFSQYGLPPGPINNPGEEALKAALFFQDHQFLFFIRDGSGGHSYAETLNEYNSLIRKLNR